MEDEWKRRRRRMRTIEVDGPNGGGVDRQLAPAPRERCPGILRYYSLSSSFPSLSLSLLLFLFYLCPTLTRFYVRPTGILDSLLSSASYWLPMPTDLVQRIQLHLYVNERESNLEYLTNLQIYILSNILLYYYYVILEKILDMELFFLF